ncbi:hypothetical protein Y032_0003g1627 [Ancylostoma ceylanicum]|nr:hypothetical protein Y032_0003g1627 [Ancylostoma ceylanicum]
MATRLNPYRNIFFAVAIISVVFSILIVVENVFFLSATGNRNVFLLLLPYLLSWALVTVACVFARVAFLLRASNVKCDILRLSINKKEGESTETNVVFFFLDLNRAARPFIPISERIGTKLMMPGST